MNTFYFTKEQGHPITFSDNRFYVDISKLGLTDIKEGDKIKLINTDNPNKPSIVFQCYAISESWTGSSFRKYGNAYTHSYKFQSIEGGKFHTNLIIFNN